MTETPPLEYGRYATVRRRWMRRSLWFAVISITCLSGWRWGPPLWDRATLLYWQRQCLNYTPPADQVVYEEEPSAAARLLTQPQYGPYPINRSQAIRISIHPQYPARSGVSGEPAPAHTLNAASYEPDCLRHFFICWSPAPIPAVLLTSSSHANRAIAFLHERISPSGNRRLVLVRCNPEVDTFTGQFIDGFNCNNLAFTPGTWAQRPAISPKPIDLDVASGWPRIPPNFRIYAGQPDPQNTAHFTIRYEMWGQSDTLDGYLDDQDNVTLTARHRPQEPH